MKYKWKMKILLSMHQRRKMKLVDAIANTRIENAFSFSNQIRLLNIYKLYEKYLYVIRI